MLDKKNSFYFKEASFKNDTKKGKEWNITYDYGGGSVPVTFSGQYILPALLGI